MKTSFAQQYIEEFSDLCEKLYWDELEYVLPKLLDILPYVKDQDDRDHWELIRNEFISLVEMKAFDSAIFALIPKNLQVAFRKDDVLNFDFHEHGRPLRKLSYRSSSRVFSMGMLSAYLRYLLDVRNFGCEEDVVVLMRDHLRLV